MTKAEILHFFNTHQDEMYERFGVVKVALFGSYATDSASEESDIDVYAKFEQNKYRKIAGFWNYLEKHLGKKVDLLHEHKHMRPALRESITKELIYG